jgi:N-acyl-D-amino-acid deacylase
MLSWATESLIQDGRSMSDIMQGITLEVMGEGDSMGPLTDSMKVYAEKSQGDIKYKIEWKTLGGYLDYLEKRGVSTNVASFVGASTVRAMELGYANRKPTAEELGRMKKHVENNVGYCWKNVSSFSVIFKNFSFQSSLFQIQY